MGTPDKIILEIEKTDEGYNIINGAAITHENYAVKDRNELFVILNIFLNLLDNNNIDRPIGH